MYKGNDFNQAHIWDFSIYILTQTDGSDTLNLIVYDGFPAKADGNHVLIYSLAIDSGDSYVP